MKTFTRLLVGFLSLALIYVSCDDDELSEVDSPHLNTIVQFSRADSTIYENGSFSVITLRFNRAASADGNLQLSLDTSSAKYINTVPAHSAGRINLVIRKGETKAMLSITKTEII